MTRKTSTTVRISDEARRLWHEIAKADQKPTTWRQKPNNTETLERMIFEEAQRRGITPSEQPA